MPPPPQAQCSYVPLDVLQAAFPPKKRFTVATCYLHSGEQSTVYVLDEQPLFFTAPHPITSQPVLVPSVYALWRIANHVPIFYTSMFA